MRRRDIGRAAWAAACLVVVAASVAAGQAACGPEGGCTNPAPRVTFTSPAVTLASPYTLETYYRGDAAIDLATRAVRLNGALVAQGAVRTVRSPDGLEAWGADTLILRPGANTVEVTVCAASAPGVAGACTTPAARFAVTSNAPSPAPVETRAAPEITTSAQPVEFGPLADAGTSLTHTTPAYTSDGQPRAVTLEYHSAAGSAQGFLQVDVTDRSAEPPHRMSLRVRGAEGTWLTGETFFEGGAGTLRMAAAWEMGVSSTGVHPVTAVVRSYWADGAYRETTAEVMVPVLSPWNGVASGLPPGWEIAGRQRIRYVARDGVMWLTEGSGRVIGFRRAGDGTWRSPPGELTTLADTTGGYVRRYPDGGRVLFGTHGETVAEVDALGRRTTWEHEGAHVQGIIDPAGNRTSFVYDASGALTQIRDPMGRVTALEVDAPAGLWSARAFRVIDVDGAVALSATFEGGRAVRWTSRGTGEWQAQYGSDGSLTQLVAPENRGGEYPVFRMRAATSDVLPLRGTGTPAAPARRIRPDAPRAVSVSAANDSIRRAIDRFGNVTRTELPKGLVATAAHDEETGLPLREVAENGTVTTYGWLPAGRLSSSATQAADGTRLDGVRIDYDPACPRMPRRVARDGGATFLTYDALCRVRTVREGSETALGVLYDYDALSRVWLVTTRVGAVPAGEASVAARGALVADRDGSVTEHHYRSDALRNLDLVRVHTRGAIHETRFEYDRFGRIVAVVDPAGRAHRRAYDALNRIVEETDPDGRVTSYVHGPAHTRVHDANHRGYWFYRNPTGRVIAATDPEGTRHVWYDGDGSPVQWRNRRGQVTNATYDALGRMRSHTSAEGGTTTFAYGDRGEWIVARNETATDTVRLDALGRPAETVTVLGGRRYVQRSTYRSDGARESYALVLPGRTLSRRDRYDASGMLRWLGDLAGDSTRIVYDDAMRPSALTLPGGLVRSVGYDARSLPASLRYSFGGAAVLPSLGGTFGYDALRRLASTATEDGGAQRHFEYDRQGQLSRYLDSRHWTAWVCEEGPADKRCEERRLGEVTAVVDLTYDGTGNRTGTAATVPESNRYAHFGGFTLTYDADGNLTRKEKPGVADQRLTWNSLGQLVRVADALRGTAVEFAYDAFGRRVRRTEQPGARETYFLYDGEHLAAEVDAGGGLVRGYTMFPGVDRPHSMVTPGPGGGLVQHLYAADPLGNVTALLSRAGALVNEYRYEPFGSAEPGYPRESVPNPLRYKGREHDGATGMYYMRTRWYDPDLDRFVSSDPIGIAGGINTYAFAGNDPVNLRDPGGLSPELVCGIPLASGGYLCPALSNAASWIYEAWFLRPGPQVGMQAPWRNLGRGDETRRIDLRPLVAKGDVTAAVSTWGKGHGTTIADCMIHATFVAGSTVSLVRGGAGMVRSSLDVRRARSLLGSARPGRERATLQRAIDQGTVEAWKGLGAFALPAVGSPDFARGVLQDVVESIAFDNPLSGFSYLLPAVVDYADDLGPVAATCSQMSSGGGMGI